MLKVIPAIALIYIGYTVLRKPKVIYKKDTPLSNIKLGAKIAPMDIQSFRRGGNFAHDSGHPDEWTFKQHVSKLGISDLHDVYTDKLLGNIHQLNDRHFDTLNTRRIQSVAPPDWQQKSTQFLSNWYPEMFQKSDKNYFVTRVSFPHI
jgi:hypothetical protein